MGGSLYQYVNYLRHIHGIGELSAESIVASYRAHPAELNKFLDRVIDAVAPPWLPKLYYVEAGDTLNPYIFQVRQSGVVDKMAIVST